MGDGISSTKRNDTVEDKEIVVADWDEKTFFPFQEDRERQQIRLDQHAASFPKLGIGALVGALFLIALSAAILLVIQGPGKVVSDWTVHVYKTHHYVTIPKPAAWLSGILSGISVCFSIALSEGLNIAWWYHVRQENATVRDLHDIWGHGTSTWTVVKSGARDLKNVTVGLSRRATNSKDQSRSYGQRKHFSYVALATLFVATIPLNGFLLQNAVVVRLQPAEKNSSVKVPMLDGDGFIAAQLVAAMPEVYGGGGVTDWTQMLGHLSQIVTPKITAAANLGSFNTTCLGSCSTVVKAMGFKIECEDSVQPYDIPIDPNNYNNAPFTPAVKSMHVNGTNIADVAITYAYPKTNRVILRSMWKDKATCKGNYSVQTCHLDLATVAYPIIINSGVKEATKSGLRNTTILTLGMDLLKESPEVINVISSSPIVARDSNYPVAGLAGLFAQTLNSSINLRYSTTAYYGSSFTAQGLFAQQQLARADTFTLPSCQGTIGNVTEQALATIKSMMFQLGAYTWLSTFGTNDLTKFPSNPPPHESIAHFVADNTPNPLALQSYQRNEYEIIWPWYFGALTVTLLVSICILPTYWGYWRLERKTTMSPFETARAFHAPVLYQRDSSVPSADLIKKVGNVRIHHDLPMLPVNEPDIVRHGPSSGA